MILEEFSCTGCSTSNKYNYAVLVIPSHSKVVEGYRVCPVRMYVHTYLRMFTFCHRASDLIYYPISI